MQHWYTLYTKPHREPLVLRQLETRGLDAFFPCIRLERGHRRGVRMEPFFPHYLFVHTDLTAPEAAAIPWLIGMRNIVRVGEQPAIVPDQVIERLRAKLDPYQDKVLKRAEWIFKPGQQVEITSGPFAGFDAVFQQGLSGGRRVQILLNLMGAWTKTQLSADEVKPIVGHSEHR